MKKLTTLLFFFLIINQLHAQPCDTSALIIEQVRASDTDANIPWELARHHAFYNPDCNEKGVLLIHLVGTFGDPYQTIYFPSLAANNGIHVLSLKYPNDLSAQTACSSSNDPDCHLKFRREIIEGVDYSPEVSVDSVNSISNRLIRLLQYMDVNFPAQNWGQFYTVDSIHWNKVMISGHSQGGGHAAVMGIDRPLKRVLMFASPNDYSNTFSQTAPWTLDPHVTPDSAYYSFNNINDDIAQYDWQYSAAINLGEGTFGDTVNVEYNQCPYQYSHNLYTDRDSSGLSVNHGMVVNDANVPLDANGVSVFQEVWMYMLGLDCLPLSVIDHPDFGVSVYPNPASELLHVQSDILIESVKVYELSGKLILELKGNEIGEVISLDEFEQGIYLFEFTSENGQQRIEKIVVRRD